MRNPIESCSVPASDDAKFEDAQEVLQELTELTALLATELRGVTGRLSAVVQDQMQVMDTLAQVEARVAALEATRDPAPAGMPAEPDERGAREALRREVQQTARHTRELVSESRALVTQAEPLLRTPSGLDSDGRDATPKRSKPPAEDASSKRPILDGAPETPGERAD